MKQRKSLKLIWLFCFLLAPILAQDDYDYDSCEETQYKCEQSGICIDKEKICNGVVDCEDHKEDEWTCNDDPTKCIGPIKVCDGIQDCDDNSDEEECCVGCKLNFLDYHLFFWF